MPQRNMIQTGGKTAKFMDSVQEITFLSPPFTSRNKLTTIAPQVEANKKANVFEQFRKHMFSVGHSL